MISYNFFATLAVWHMAKVRTTWKNEAQGTRFFTHMGPCDSFWHQKFVHEITAWQGKTAVTLHTGANLCKLEATLQRALSGNISIECYVTALAEKSTVQYLFKRHDTMKVT